MQFKVIKSGKRVPHCSELGAHLGHAGAAALQAQKAPQPSWLRWPPPLGPLPARGRETIVSSFPKHGIGSGTAACEPASQQHTLLTSATDLRSRPSAVPAPVAGGRLVGCRLGWAVLGAPAAGPRGRGTEATQAGKSLGMHVAGHCIPQTQRQRGKRLPYQLQAAPRCARGPWTRLPWRCS